MGEWAFEAILEAAQDMDGPSNKRVAAKKRLRAEGDGRTNSGVPTADAPMEQLVNRLEGMPQKAPDVVVNVGPTLAVTTEQVFDRIDAYLASSSRTAFDVATPGDGEGLPADLPQLPDGETGSPGRSDGEADSEGPTR
jgi:hypothetical protein